MSQPDATTLAPASPEAPPTKVLSWRVFSWAFWDWGSAAFNAVATTFVFSVYLTGDKVFTDAGTASEHLSTGLTIAGISVGIGLAVLLAFQASRTLSAVRRAQDRK